MVSYVYQQINLRRSLLNFRNFVAVSMDWQEARAKHLSIELNKKVTVGRGSKVVQVENIPTWPLYAKTRKLVGENSERAVNHAINEKVSVYQGDITLLAVGCIVNAANESLLGGGGVDGCIHRAAGRHLRAECETLNGCTAGDAKLTGGYELAARYIVHTVGPRGERPELLRSCYERSLRLMLDAGQRSIAFPCISTGVFGYPPDRAAHVALRTVRSWLEEPSNQASTDRVIFCLFLNSDVDIYDRLAPLYFPI